MPIKKNSPMQLPESEMSSILANSSTEEDSMNAKGMGIISVENASTSPEREVIYTMTSLKENGPHRTWGWTKTFESAEKIVKGGASFFEEAGAFTHCLIEEVEQGTVPWCKPIQWYKLVYYGRLGKFVAKKCKEPKWSKHICNYSMGLLRKDLFDKKFSYFSDNVFFECSHRYVLKPGFRH